MSFLNVCKRLKNVLDREREEKLNVRKLEQYYTDSLPVLQTNFFCSLMEGQHFQMGKYTNIFVTIRYRCRVHITAVQSCIHRKTIFPMGCLRSCSPCLSKGRHGKDSVTDGIADIFAYLGNIVMLVNLRQKRMESRN